MKIKKKRKPDTIYNHPLNQIQGMFPDGGTLQRGIEEGYLERVSKTGRTFYYKNYK